MKRDEYNRIIITPEILSLYEEMKESIDEKVDRVFSLYCKANNIREAYGVEKWEDLGKDLLITQDTSYRGCYDNQSHKIPIKFLFMKQDEIKAELDAMNVAKAEREREERQEAKKARDAKRLEELRSKLSSLTSDETRAREIAETEELIRKLSADDEGDTPSP